MTKWFWLTVGNLGQNLMIFATEHGWPFHDDWDELADEAWRLQQEELAMYEQAKSEGYADAMDDIRHQGM